ncbi:chemotaxis protein CheA [Polynucleobacter paneuropaeus]|uniref:Chemotaxis protein CheA n=1 Tax=Polynucleobacter paneuropaeus TaxID=2527775 RepID=A0AAE2YJ17_9BURK|nr:chemotaxis protein CheA [Polynucleobacter paneuropaeus]MBT8590441.1 chemotaxis protein CheA [Polynucleobacter paneuropaeus]MBT8595817.1 chemotaxis protein CheA [Polynucleobacter paneuropaeus]MBT8597644.1 chemotaxis protein CheA [Polynucleobacter paneuropaeus]
MDNNDQILDEFLLEAGEIFDQLDLDFVQLEQTPGDKKLIGNIFRAMHTLKGSSGFFAFHRLEKVAHAGESLLSKLRDGVFTLNEEMTDVLLETSDRLRAIVDGVQKKRQEPEGDDSALIQNLKFLTDGGTVVTKTTSAPPVNPKVEVVIEPAPQVIAEKIFEADIADLEQDVLEAVKEVSIDAAVNEAENSKELAAPVKVSVELLDKLMNLVSEMVLARNRLLSFARTSGDLAFNNTVRRIDTVTLELQERMMKTRMQSISQVWAKFPRLVRDIAQDCGKKVELIQIGAETELDRTLLEGIRDPLVHIIRNSVDHGIEQPAERRAKGKPELGTVKLRAFHENGMVVIEIADDGAGIDIPLVKQKAIQLGLVTAERAAKLTEREIIDFIYLPGFSTKAEITNLSGRGVGMDVVRTNIQEIGGTVDIATSAQGTRLRLSIPLTLAIMPAVFVRCKQYSYAIPQVNVIEMLRYEPREGVPGVEDFYGVPVFRLRDKLIPLVFLNYELKIDDVLPAVDQTLNIVIVQAGGIRFGLVVDEVLYMQEVVVKSVGPLLKGTPVYSGSTILGDGHVALIFDINAIAVRSGIIAKLADNQFEQDISAALGANNDSQQMLMFDLLGLERMVIPLETVDRLEMIAATRIDRRGNEAVVLYGNKIMRLISLAHFVEGASQKSLYGDETVPVIVHYHHGQPVGFIVKKVHNIVNVPTQVIMVSPPQRGIMGSVIVNDSVMSILNVQEVLNLSGLGPHQEPGLAGDHFVDNDVITMDREDK